VVLQDVVRVGFCSGGVMAPWEAVPLAYGHALEMWPYLCLSEERGVSCVDQERMIGFRLARAGMTPLA
jgi:hypothetical protein